MSAHQGREGMGQRKDGRAGKKGTMERKGNGGVRGERETDQQTCATSRIAPPAGARDITHLRPAREIAPLPRPATAPARRPRWCRRWR